MKTCLERWRGRGWTSGCLTVWAEGLAGRGPPWVPCVSRATPEAGPGPPGGGQEGARPTALPLTRVLSRSDKSGGSLCWGWGSAGSGNNPRPPDRERFTSILLLAGAAAPRVLEARGRALPSLPPLPPPPVSGPAGRQGSPVRSKYLWQAAVSAATNTMNSLKSTSASPLASRSLSSLSTASLSLLV